MWHSSCEWRRVDADGYKRGCNTGFLAVDDLYRSHVAEVYRYAYAMLGNRSDAEDVTQTTFVNALGALERGERPRKPSNWLITITHNIVRQRFRQQQARPAEVELDDDVASEEPQHDGPSVEDLVRALQGIPPTQRAALVMRELEGRTYKEIEALLELTPAALETLLFRARRRSRAENRTRGRARHVERARRPSLAEERRRSQPSRDCPSCARLHAAGRSIAGRSSTSSPPPFRSPLRAPTASAAGGLSTIGTGGVTAVAGVGWRPWRHDARRPAEAWHKAVAVAAATMAGSVGYEGEARSMNAGRAPRLSLHRRARHWLLRRSRLRRRGC
jgi:RNA polymerase sigma-70 factor (ECF subfamily)